MGLFGRNKQKAIEKDLYKRHPEYKVMHDSIVHQQKLTDLMNTALERYKKDKDLDKIIKVYEKIFIEADPPCESSKDVDLAKYYIRAGQNDKAWSYLNLLLTRPRSNEKKIREQQIRILKKEGREVPAWMEERAK